MILSAKNWDRYYIAREAFVQAAAQSALYTEDADSPFQPDARRRRLSNEEWERVASACARAAIIFCEVAEVQFRSLRPIRKKPRTPKKPPLAKTSPKKGRSK
jgi:hypothetical protein